MFDAHRKFHSCILCGSTTGLSREHIFGKTLAGRLDVAHHWTSDRRDGPPVKGSAPITSITAKLACQPCNNGPLGEDMNSSIEPLLSLIEGARFSLTPREQAAVVRYWERVGLIVDVMTSSHELREHYKETEEFKRSEPHRRSPPLYSDEQRQAWRLGGKLSNMRIHVGYHKGVLGLNPMTVIAPLHTLGADGALGVCEKRFLVAIRHLVVCVGMGPFVVSIPASMQALSSDCETNFEWPRKNLVSYEDFFGMQNHSPEHAVLELLSIPVMRDWIEWHSRKIGSFEVPAEVYTTDAVVLDAALQAILR